jgi:hypothetical protein
VNLVFTNEDTGIVREVTTTADGSYFVAQLIPGRYRINARLDGFKTLDRRGVVTTVGVTTNLDLALEVGGVAETVTVTGEAPLIDITTAEIGGHISAAELAELPAGVRSYMAFVGTVPGAIFVPATGFLNETMAANGQPQAANNISMDGSTNVDDLRGTGPGGQARVPNEALQEVQVLTNQYDAEYGRASGAVINAVTKSGTNLFSGAAFALFTDKSIIAKDFFTRANNLPKPDVGKEEWGGTIGGPMLRTGSSSLRRSSGSHRTGTRRASFPPARSSTSRMRVRSRPGPRCGASTIRSTRAIPGRSGGCASSGRSSTEPGPGGTRSDPMATRPISMKRWLGRSPA